MSASKLETQSRDAASFERPTFYAGPPQSAVIIDGFHFSDKYPDHNPGTDGAMHVPAEGFVKRKVADIVEVRIATDSIDTLQTQMYRLVEIASQDQARGDLAVPQVDNVTPVENLTSYLRTVIDGKVLEAHRSVVEENKDNQRIINELLSLIHEQSPELVSSSERILGDRLIHQSVSPHELDGSIVETTPRIRKMDRLLTTPMGKGALRLVQMLKHPFDTSSLEKVS